MHITGYVYIYIYMYIYIYIYIYVYIDFYLAADGSVNPYAKKYLCLVNLHVLGKPAAW